MKCSKCSKEIEEDDLHVMFFREKRVLCHECHRWYSNLLVFHDNILTEAFFNPTKECLDELHKFQPERLNPEDTSNSVCDSLNNDGSR